MTGLSLDQVYLFVEDGYFFSDSIYLIDGVLYLVVGICLQSLQVLRILVKIIAELLGITYELTSLRVVSSVSFYAVESVEHLRIESREAWICCIVRVVILYLLHVILFDARLAVVRLIFPILYIIVLVSHTGNRICRYTCTYGSVRCVRAE